MIGVITLTKRDILDSIYYALALIVIIIAFFDIQVAMLLGFLEMLIYIPFAVVIRIMEY